MFLIMQWSIDRGFLQYVNRLEQQRLEKLAIKLEQAHGVRGNWDFLNKEPGAVSRLISASLAEIPLSKTQQRIQEQSSESSADYQQRRTAHIERRLIVLDQQQKPVFGVTSLDEKVALRTLSVKGQQIGYLGLLPSKYLSDFHQLSFVKQQKTAYALIALVMLLVAILLSVVLARRLVRPLKELANASHALAQGQYTVRVPVNSDDELGQLSRDFNVMAHGLQNSEHARRQFIADISHELRTPLAVLGGEIEALQDGVRPLNQQAVGSLHVEVVRLNRLVEDLYQLALADVGALSYRKSEQDLIELLLEALQRAESELKRCRLTLSTILPKNEIVIYGDTERLGQLFDNLLRNTVAYTDPGGKVTVKVECLAQCAVIEIMDSAPGVPPDEEKKLFDRLYRLEESRNRASGGAGLGLAICRNIVDAHDGVIEAAPSPLGGLMIRITLPFMEQPA